MAAVRDTGCARRWSRIAAPVVDRTFPFDALNDAIDHVATGQAKGKVVVDVLAGG